MFDSLIIKKLLIQYNTNDWKKYEKKIYIYTIIK